ncbi:FtsX-like permease family protein [Streptomyces sp. PSKA54]|uniref:FtsX-like permease family protein n=1 Tax=Streptomyces himalayensis subsp. aureolus TaxID=2758039 RepID=A0A7W2HHT2_9ACTN|nr:FtsX-like permease family protein [Streptomyces himalayensis]MBA4864301.1 FtsX-like permease family protein [Streptomyces himalayensis subsp. aureolus]
MSRPRDPAPTGRARRRAGGSIPRWSKVRRDIVVASGRMAVMVLAIAAGVTGIGAVLSAGSILSREISRNYLDTTPASATLEMDKVDDALVEQVRLRPGIADAEARATVTAQAKLGPDQWRQLLLFVVPDFNAMRMSTFTPQSGAWPPPDGTMLVERTAQAMLERTTGQSIEVRLPGGTTRDISVSGVVHDPSLAPAQQERMGYAYITPQTLVRLGGSATLDELKIRVDGDSRAEIQEVADDLGTWLPSQGRQVHEIQIPPPGKHPHASQMQAVLLVLLIFAGLGLVLSAILVATVIGGMLTQQIRQIGVMKAVGARTSQIAGMYALQVLAIGAAATIISVPLGIMGGRGFADAVSELLNLDLASKAVPAWVFAVQFASGLLVPLLVAAAPIRRAARITVREAISDYGVRPESLSARLKGLNLTLLMALRNAFRRPGRLVLTLGLMSAGGALFIGGLNVAAAWERNVDDGFATRHYDLEARLSDPERVEPLADQLRATPGVRSVETWGFAPAGVARTGGIETVSTYPDGGHGSFSIRGVPEDTSLVSFPATAGRWLRPGDTDAVVLNSMAKNPLPDAKVGDSLTLSVDGRPTVWQVVGTVREVGSPAAAYVSKTAFEQRIDPPRDLRIATSDVPAAQRVLRDESVDRVTLSTAELREAVDGHVYLLIVALVALAVLMAIVGVLGLAAATGTSVAERTREFGVMQTIGATPRTVISVVIGETLFVGLLSVALATLLSIPISLVVGNLIGDLAFRTPLPLTISPLAIAIWALTALLGSALAGAAPARRASRFTIRQALAYV